jgi:hypothetical protein
LSRPELPQPEVTDSRSGSHQVALWAGISAFFGSLLAIGIFDILEPDKWVEYFGAIIVSVITAGAVYSKQRLDDVKRESQPDTQKP